MFSEFTSKSQSYGPAHPTRSSLNRNVRDRIADDKYEESLSDTAVGSMKHQTSKKLEERTESDEIKKSTENLGSSTNLSKTSNLGKKSNSTSQLSVTGKIFYIFIL